MHEDLGVSKACVANLEPGVVLLTLNLRPEKLMMGVGYTIQVLEYGEYYGVRKK